MVLPRKSEMENLFLPKFPEKIHSVAKVQVPSSEQSWGLLLVRETVKQESAHPKHKYSS